MAVRQPEELEVCFVQGGDARLAGSRMLPVARCGLDGGGMGAEVELVCDPVKRAWPAEVVALTATDAEIAQHVEFGRVLDAFSDDHRASLGGERDECGGQRTTDRVQV